MVLVAEMKSKGESEPQDCQELRVGLFTVLAYFILGKSARVATRWRKWKERGSTIDFIFVTPFILPCRNSLIYPPFAPDLHNG